MSGRFGGGMHAVLRNFVHASGRWLDAQAIEMIQWDAALSDSVAFFDGLGDVGFRESGGFR